ncbi:hypothetical protein PIB30_051512 [Stylosanthes scabra]|uniref:Uncharacterized protein n=1 Tax=Stylosanthes scabra TaxID=79078 RepID=A0ABU6SHU1_9FABA|nr:hypothetical protein [Stylosanthes scabra]
MGYLWKPPSAHTIQAERPMSKPEAGQVRCRAHDGGNQKGVLSMWYLARDMELDMYAEKRVSDKGTITAIRSDLTPRFAIAIFLSRLAVVVVVPPPPGLVSASCVTRCLSSWEAMGIVRKGDQERRRSNMGEAKGNRKCVAEGLVLVIR